MERQLPQPLALGDVKDVEAYVRAIVATLRLGERDEFEEYVADALELVVQRQKALRPGQSLQRSLAGCFAGVCKIAGASATRNGAETRAGRPPTACRPQPGLPGSTLETKEKSPPSQPTRKSASFRAASNSPPSATRQNSATRAGSVASAASPPGQRFRPAPHTNSGC